MDAGLLLLRVLLAVILFAHAGQKTLGWFQGQGIGKMAGVFENLGLKPGRVMVLAAAVAEVCGAISLLLGFLTPAGALITAATMAVAGLTMQRAAGSFWNAAGGGEYPFVLAVMAVAIGFTGPGALSIDRAIQHLLPAGEALLGANLIVGVTIPVLAVVALIPFALRLRRSSGARAEG